ncbi:hypothetical protein PoB_006889400 [Plakobranchus ocellatus]|uniref:Uncharacterized protein n=1 Tax=Plakobranchus ocellatus TaxID=259542 RepID=A0AAV4DE29_9GAST|nr:hypothetical protein PoB_006889400 [Plakobranchus ocellatus]
MPQFWHRPGLLRGRALPVSAKETGRCERYKLNQTGHVMKDQTESHASGFLPISCCDKLVGRRRRYYKESTRKLRHGEKTRLSLSNSAET